MTNPDLKQWKEIDRIIEMWKKFIDSKDEDWIYDECYEFFNGLSRSEMLTIMDYLLTKQDANN